VYKRKFIIIAVIFVSALIFASLVYADYTKCPYCGSPDIEFKTVYYYNYQECPTPGCDIVQEQRIEYWKCDDPECGSVWDMEDYWDSWHTDPGCPYSPRE
jgi:hypothetical protein